MSNLKTWPEKIYASQYIQEDGPQEPEFIDLDEAVVSINKLGNYWSGAEYIRADIAKECEAKLVKLVRALIDRAYGEDDETMPKLEELKP